MNHFLSTSLFLIYIISFQSSCNPDDNSCCNPDDNKNIGTCNNYPSPDLVIATHSGWTKTHYTQRIAEFKNTPLQTGDIVFLGDSLTEFGGDWGDRAQNTKVKNRGIAGDTTDGVIARLGEIICFKPSQVFVLIGINDLFRNDMSSQKVYENILLIVKTIHDQSVDTKIFVQTILPTTTLGFKKKIDLTNQLLDASKNTEDYTLIPLHAFFDLDNGLMNVKLSTDGIHLNEDGYILWSDQVVPLIN